MSENGSQQGSHQERVEGKTRIFLRPLASPVPLAFFAFGVGSFLQSVLQLGWIPEDETRNVALILGAFVFPAELIAASSPSSRAKLWALRCSASSLSPGSRPRS